MKKSTCFVEMSSSSNFPARAKPSYEGSEPGHFNFRAEKFLSPNYELKYVSSFTAIKIGKKRVQAIICLTRFQLIFLQIHSMIFVGFQECKVLLYSGGM